MLSYTALSQLKGMQAWMAPTPSRIRTCTLSSRTLGRTLASAASKCLAAMRGVPSGPTMLAGGHTLPAARSQYLRIIRNDTGELAALLCRQSAT